MIITKCRIGLTQDREQTESDSKLKVPTLRAETWCKSQNASTPCFFLYFKHFHLSFILNSVTFGHLYYESATFCLRGNPKEKYQVRQIFLILTKVLHTNDGGAMTLPDTTWRGNASYSGWVCTRNRQPETDSVGSWEAASLKRTAFQGR